MPPITTPFGFRSTAAEVAAGIDLSGKRAVVTGGASGIGVETARALAGAGAAVTLAVRDTEAGARVAAEIAAGVAGTSATGSVAGAGATGTVTVAPLDLVGRASIAAFAAAWDGPLDILVNNAGVMATPEQYSPEGFEHQFATNHLGHFALALGLHDALAAARDARIVVVSSSANLISPVIFDDVDFDFRFYDPGAAYGQSKTANVLFAVGATRRWADDGITANALNPGAIATRLQRHVGNRLQTPPERQKTTEQGAATSVLLATSPLLEGIGGRYFEDCNEAAVLDRRSADFSGVARYALDPANAERLWELSLERVG